MAYEDTALGAKSGHQLGVAADLVFTEGARRALADAIDEAGGNEVFFFGSLDEAGLVSLVEVIARGNDSMVPVFLERAGEHQVLIHNHPGGDLTPSPADLAVAGEAGVRGLGFFIIDSAATRVYRVVEPFDRAQIEPLNEEEIGDMFAAEGLLSRAIPQFEDRSGQRDLAISMTRAFNAGEVVAFEAGTGIGKSFAYLVPSILWALRNRSRVVISTQTIALQEQLIHKDLPLLSRVLPEKFTYALIKGRGNYACRRKAGEVGREPDLFGTDPERERWNQEILDRLAHSQEGSLSDLSRTPPAEVWADFASSTEQSLKVRCKHYRECFYYNARRRAAQAQVIVVNHHLFFADLAVRLATGSYDNDLVIPGYRRVVFDEAHRLEEVAAQHFGAQFSRLGSLQNIGRFLAPHPKQRGRERGRMLYVASVLRKEGARAASEQLEMELLPRFRDVRERVEQVFDELRTRLAEAFATSDDPTLSGPAMLRVGDRPGDVPFDLLFGPLQDLRLDWKLLKRDLARGRDLMLDHPFEPKERFEGLLGEFRAAIRRVDEQMSAIDRFLADDRGMLAWIELGGGGRPNLQLRVAPVRVAEMLAEHLYRPLDSVAMTSATLSVDGRWDFLGDRLGWELTEEGRFRGAEFESPFDFAKQALLALPDDLPSPDARSFDAAFAQLVLDCADATRGRTFVLFTSYRMLRSVVNRTRSSLEAAGFPCLVQGEEPRSELLRRFRELGNAILFGNQSFWEGVDVPGSALSCVVIARLPFRVPTHPLEVGRAEEVEARGMSPFRHLAIPQAVLSLKQGFGRLIRTQSDRGVVVIADKRIRSSNYGHLFLRSLPSCRTLDGPWTSVLSSIRSFFDAEDPEPIESKTEPASEFEAPDFEAKNF